MKVWALPSVQSVTDWTQLRRFVSQNTTNVSQILSNNVAFLDNVFCQIVRVQISATEATRIPHSLGVIPIGTITLKQSVAGSTIETSVVWTTNEIYLQASTAGEYTIAILGG